MKAKYYTPETKELKEIYTPYQYRYNYKNSSKEWLDIEEEDYYDRLLSDHIQVRVKHLDRPDIESLGWKLQYSENTMWDYYKKEGTDNVLYHDKKDLITNGVWIKWMNHNNSQWHPCRYILKNKSELSALMKFKEI